MLRSVIVPEAGTLIVLVTPVFAAREIVQNEPAALSRNLAELVVGAGGKARFEPTLDRAVATLDDELKPGDVVIIPAGVAHKCLEHDKDFTVIGAYPAGQNYDMMKGRKDERPAADERIRSVPLPEADPVFGADGPLMRHW